MDSAHAGSVFIHAFEEITRNPDMCFMARLREPVARDRVVETYERQVRARETLRMQWTSDRAAKRYGWRPLEGDSLEERLAAERADAGPERTDPIAEYVPIGTRLHYRVVVLDDRTLLFRISHALCNGLGGLFWIEDWLGFLGSTADGVPELPDGTHENRRRGWPQAVRGVGSVVSYALGFLRAAGRRAVEQTVDLTHGRHADVHAGGYGRWSHVLTSSETSALVAASRERGLSVTALLATFVARALFEAAPDKRRVGMLVPADLNAYMPGRELSDPGNPTGGLVLQFFRERDLEAQAVEGLAHAHRGVPYWAARMMDVFARDELGLAESIRKGARKPASKRGLFDSYSASLTNFGVHPQFRRQQEAFEDITGYGFSQTLMFAVCNVGGAMTLGLTFPRDLFEEEEVVVTVAQRVAEQATNI